MTTFRHIFTSVWNIWSLVLCLFIFSHPTVLSQQGMMVVVVSYIIGSFAYFIPLTVLFLEKLNLKVLLSEFLMAIATVVILTYITMRMV